jgi:hypothetical protein
VTPTVPQATLTGDNVEPYGYWHEPQHHHEIQLEKVEVVDVIAEATEIPEQSSRPRGQYQARHW